MKKINIQLEELVCPMCATKIESSLKKLKGVEEVSVLYNSSKAKVTYDENLVDNDKIVQAINKVGYDVLKIKE